MSTMGISCCDFVEVVTDFRLGALPLSQSIRTRLHLWSCADCRAHDRQMRYTAQALRHLPQQSVPERSREDLIRRFREQRAGR